MVQKIFNIVNIFNISAFSSTFLNCRLGINIFNISAVSSVFGGNMLKTAEMLKSMCFHALKAAMVQKTFNIFSIFNFSAVSSIF